MGLILAYVVGMDAGGTKTVAYLGDDQGKIIAKASGGAGNYHTAGKESVKETFQQLIHELCKEVEISAEEIEVISIGAAGVDRKEDKLVVKEIFTEAGFDCEKIISNDGRIALVGAQGKEEGIVTICGTGSIALGITDDGKLIRSGGWGHLIDDEGSGYYISAKALNAVVKDADGRGESTILTEKVLNFLDTSNPEKIIEFVYGEGVQKGDIAKIAPLVFESAAEDKIAMRILDDAVDGLVQMAVALIQKGDYGSTKVPVALAGGVFDNVDLIRDKFSDKLSKQGYNVEIINSKFDAAIGALIIAWNKAEIEYKEDQLG